MGAGKKIFLFISIMIIIGGIDSCTRTNGMTYCTDHHDLTRTIADYGEVGHITILKWASPGPNYCSLAKLYSTVILADSCGDQSIPCVICKVTSAEEEWNAGGEGDATATPSSHPNHPDYAQPSYRGLNPLANEGDEMLDMGQKELDRGNYAVGYTLKAIAVLTTSTGTVVVILLVLQKLLRNRHHQSNNPSVTWQADPDQVVVHHSGAGGQQGNSGDENPPSYESLEAAAADGYGSEASEELNKGEEGDGSDGSNPSRSFHMDQDSLASSKGSGGHQAVRDHQGGGYDSEASEELGYETNSSNQTDKGEEGDGSLLSRSCQTDQDSLASSKGSGGDEAAPDHNGGGYDSEASGELDKREKVDGSILSRRSCQTDQDSLASSKGSGGDEAAPDHNGGGYDSEASGELDKGEKVDGSILSRRSCQTDQDSLASSKGSGGDEAAPDLPLTPGGGYDSEASGDEPILD